MQNLGVALIDPVAGTVLRSWDEMPSVIPHAGENRTGAIVGAEFSGGALLVARVLESVPVPGAVVETEAERIEDGRVVVTRTYGPPDPSVLIAAAQTAIDAHIDAVARSRGYGSGVSLTSYVQSTNAAWRAEAEAFVAWRDQVWLYAHQQLAAVQTGQREPPTPDDLIVELPAIAWPGGVP